MGDEGRGDPAFMDPVLVLTERSVRQRGPALAIAGEGFRSSECCARIALKAKVAAFRRPTVVREEEDECIVELPRFLKGLEDLTDAAIHPLDLCGIDGHAFDGVLLLLGLQAVPSGNRLWTRSQRPVWF